MNEISIEIQLANRKYPIRVKESDTEIVYSAAKQINEKLKELEKKYKIQDIQDLLAMTALQCIVQVSEKNENTQPFAEKINHLNQLVESSIIFKN